jgi:hypothetical protein
VFAGATYVQDQFSWEAAKILEIDNCTSLTDLDSIVIVEPVTNLMPGGV